MTGPIVGLWSTTLGGNGLQSTTGSSTGDYPSTESPPLCIDGNPSTKYLSFGDCPGSSSPLTCASNTGFHLTPLIGPTIVRAVQIQTPFDSPDRDPLTMTLEGSNQTGSALFSGSSWISIYSGLTGLAMDPGRSTFGVKQVFSNSIAYTSYRVLMTSKRGSSNSIQYAEIQLLIM